MSPLGHGLVGVRPYPLKTGAGKINRVLEDDVTASFAAGVLKMASSCEEYRSQQQLLALKKRLSEDQLTPEEREELERLIQELEKKLKL